MTEEIKKIVEDYEKSVRDAAKGSCLVEQVNDHKAYSSLKAYIHEIENYTVLDNETQNKLFAEMHKLDPQSLDFKRIRDILVMSNMRFVSELASISRQNTNVPLEDLLTEGSLGLMKAIEKFDETRNVAFASYAYYWIQNHISTAIQQMISIIQVPAGMVNDVKRFCKARQILGTKLNMNPKEVPLEIIAKALKESMFKVKQLQDIVNKREVVSLEQFGTNYLNGKAGDHIADSSVKTNEIEDVDQEPVYKESERKELRARIKEILKQIGDPKLERIVRLYYGFETGVPVPLAEIAREEGVSRERIRQRKEKALHIMRAKGLIEQLQGLI